MNLPASDEIRFSCAGIFQPSPRYLKAEAFARQLHASQVRKSILTHLPPTPYFYHLEGVSAIVRDNGGDEDEQIAALLHDAIEDQAKTYPGGAVALRSKIRTEFGDRVLAIVEGCTDTDVFPKPDWDTRKIDYIHHVRNILQLEPQHAASILLVSASDKLHNATAILNDIRNPQIGPNKAFEIFNGGKRGRVEGTVWYYESLVKAYQSIPAFGTKPLVGKLAGVVQQIRQAAPVKP